MTLSKSEYLLFLKHPAWLWLKKHDKSKLPAVDANTQAIFDSGNLFEEYAEQLFPDGIRIGFDKGDFSTYISMPERTKQVLADGADTIFQGRFETENITCIVDIIKRVEGDTFDLFEIKASTKAKPEHEHDLAFQTRVLEKAGLKVRNISVIHINNQFVKDGVIDISKFTAITDVTKEVRALEKATEQNIRQAVQTIDSPDIPNISPRYAKMGAFSEWLDIYKSLVGPLEKDSIYNLATPSAVIGQLEDLHIEKIKDIPDEFVLKPKQRWQVETNKTGKRYIDKHNIKKFLESLEYPLYFFDYETLSSTVPPYDGLKPYSQLPFQYSLHILDKPDGKLSHKEYLHIDKTNPAEPLIIQLKADIGDKGTVLVWYETFEKGCNKLLGEIVPEQSGFMESVNERIVDLMAPFSEGWFRDKDFMGSASIKKVLPTLIPDLKYTDLDVSDGATAQRLWMQAVLEGKEDLDKETLFNNLCEYCKLDTLAMVKIYEEICKQA